MKHIPSLAALFCSAAMIPGIALAHGAGDAGQTPQGSTNTQAHQSKAYQVDDGFIPPYLLAAVCGSRGEPGDPAFERRLQLARLSDSAKGYAGESPPLLPNLGDQTYAVTVADAKVQRYFDQGLALLYAFNHPEALRAFRQARRLDPGCAMCSHDHPGYADFQSVSPEAGSMPASGDRSRSSQACWKILT